MAKKPTIPLKVTAILSDGRVNSSNEIIMFDGILYHAWYLKHYPQVFEGTAKDEYDGHIGLPLRQLPGNRWCASCGIFETLSVEIDYINKRPDFFSPSGIDKLQQDKGIISDKDGAYKAYRIPNVVRIVKDGIMVFYCMGHKNEILELLSRMSNIGKKYSIGYGIVLEWKVEEIDEDYSTFHPEYGLMRPIPVDEMQLNGYRIADFGIKPPYWKKKNERLCYVPNGR